MQVAAVGPVIMVAVPADLVVVAQVVPEILAGVLVLQQIPVVAVEVHGAVAQPVGLVDQV
jgi:hypothetical protein